MKNEKQNFHQNLNKKKKDKNIGVSVLARKRAYLGATEQEIVEVRVLGTGRKAQRRRLRGRAVDEKES